MALSENLYNLRKKRGLTLRELSEHVGITAAALSSYEKGDKEPSLSFAIRLAKFYNVSLDSLCGLNEIKNSISYVDILRFVLNLCEYSGYKIHTETESGRFITTGSNNGSNEFGFHMTGDISEADIAFYIKNKQIGEFFTTYAQLKALCANKQIPQSVFDDWLAQNLKRAETWKLPNPQEETSEAENEP